ncbi:DNA adenine methylase domain protein [Burkholderia thailandensis]|uniref:DNA adenine methylase domain protein n=1 Tax=Burkholderia thailandensis TaxID=57975 RepID=A0AAW9CXJ8_BURTH|nr:DNA adenine methylase domain protein [Burkholderia thailandensis]MDW9253399.1 DNA adenine methylase domain protein [Burkholderia thailandensis]
MNLCRVVQHYPEEFVRRFRWALRSRQVFGWLKHAVSQTLADIQPCRTLLLPSEINVD